MERLEPTEEQPHVETAQRFLFMLRFRLTALEIHLIHHKASPYTSWTCASKLRTSPHFFSTHSFRPSTCSDAFFLTHPFFDPRSMLFRSRMFWKPLALFFGSSDFLTNFQGPRAPRVLDHGAPKYHIRERKDVQWHGYTVQARTPNSCLVGSMGFAQFWISNPCLRGCVFFWISRILQLD